MYIYTVQFNGVAGVTHGICYSGHGIKKLFREEIIICGFVDVFPSVETKEEDEEENDIFAVEDGYASDTVAVPAEDILAISNPKKI